MKRLCELTVRCLAWLAGIGLLVCIGAVREQTQPATHPGTSPLPSWNLAGLQFAIADLDGDRGPDMASVEMEKQQASWASYAIRLQFNAGADSYIGVKGPLGGVRLAVRDVNGDDSLDLVLTSVVDRRVIQVLLNDGHGNFSPAEPDANPAGPVDQEHSWSASVLSPEDGASSTSSRWSFDAGTFWVSVGNAEPGAALNIGESPMRAAGHMRSCHERAPPGVIRLS